VANHTSNFDPPLITLAAKRELYFLAKEELFSSRFFGWLITTFNALPLKRGRFSKEMLWKIKDLIARKKTVLIFPEGTRSKDGCLGSFKPGVGFIAQFSGAPVVPCFVKGIKDSVIPKLVDRDLVRRGLRNSSALPRISVKFARPLYPEGNFRDFTRRLEEEIKKMAAE